MDTMTALRTREDTAIQMDGNGRKQKLHQISNPMWPNIASAFFSCQLYPPLRGLHGTIMWLCRQKTSTRAQALEVREGSIMFVPTILNNEQLLQFVVRSGTECAQKQGTSTDQKDENPEDQVPPSILFDLVAFVVSSGHVPT